jgi:VanZ family protein
VVALWIAAICIVSVGELLPGGSAPLDWVDSLGVSDKIEHFTAYFGLAVIPVLGFDTRKGLTAALSMILLGVLLDVAQKFIPGRTFDLADIAANTVGVFGGLAVARAILVISRRRRNSTGR